MMRGIEGTRGSGTQRSVGWDPSVGVISLTILSIMGLVAPWITAAADAPAVIRIWDHHVHDKKFRRDIFKEFNQANPDIRVEYTSQVSASYQSILDAAYRVGELPDLFIPMIPGSLPKAVELGWVIPIDDVAPSREELVKWMERFPPEGQPFIEGQNVFNGKVYSWPIGAEGAHMMLYWNTKLFEDAGIKGTDGGPGTPAAQPASAAPPAPAIMDDIRLFARKITQTGQGKVFGIVHGIKDGSWGADVQFPALQLGWSMGGWPWLGFDYRTGSFDYHHPGFRKYFQLWFDMKKDGSIFPGDLSMDEEQAKFKFAQDLAGMIFGGPWNPGGFLAVNPDLQFDAVLPPAEKPGEIKGRTPGGPTAGSSEYAVSRKTKNRGAVWRVITFMTSQKYQEEWVKAGGGISVFPEYNKTEFFRHPTLARIAQLTTITRTRYPVVSAAAAKVFGEIMNPGHPDINETQVGMWIGKLGWNALDELETRTNRAFEKAIEEANTLGYKVSKSDFIFPDWDPAKPSTPPKKTK